MTEFEQKLKFVLEDGHWQVYKPGMRISPLVNPKDYAKYSEMSPSGLPRSKKRKKKRKH